MQDEWTFSGNLGCLQGLSQEKSCLPDSVWLWSLTGVAAQNCCRKRPFAYIIVSDGRGPNYWARGSQKAMLLICFSSLPTGMLLLLLNFCSMTDAYYFPCKSSPRLFWSFSIMYAIGVFAITFVYDFTIAKHVSCTPVWVRGPAGEWVLEYTHRRETLRAVEGGKVVTLALSSIKAVTVIFPCRVVFCSCPCFLFSSLPISVTVASGLAFFWSWQMVFFSIVNRLSVCSLS